MPVPRKVEPHPLERIDQFIKEQKSRRAAFWNRRDAEKAPGSIGKSLAKKGPGAPGARDKGKDNTDPKLWNPVNCAEHEVHAIRAIQARTEAIQRLAQCCERVDDHIASRGGFVCNSDPVLKMFFRLVGNVRVKTIDAVECVSSWERNVGRGRAFVHKCALPLCSNEFAMCAHKVLVDFSRVLSELPCCLADFQQQHSCSGMR